MPTISGNSTSSSLHFKTKNGKKYDILGLTDTGNVHLRHGSHKWTTSWSDLTQCLSAVGIPIQDRWMQGTAQGFSTTTTYLTAQHFSSGTLRITEPGFYVLCEDVHFLPHPISPDPQDPQYTHPAYSMGFFAAITIECPGVVLDFSGHTLAQSLLHYARMRFFDTIELANAPFISQQGPGSFNQANPIASASHCVIQNGTLGLSSHAHIHGNGNKFLEIRNMCFQDFEVAAVQLNGPKHLHMESLQMCSLQTVPLDARLYSFHIHLERLQRRTAQFPQLARLVEKMEAVQEELLAPFRATYPGKTTAQALAEIYTHLKCHTRGDARFFVNRTGLPDGSAIYGIVIWCLGVSIGALRQACVKRGEGGKASRASDIHIEDVLIHGLKLHARESIARLDAEGKTLGDTTGAVVEYHLERNRPLPILWTLARKVLLWLDGGDSPNVQESMRALSVRKDVCCRRGSRSQGGALCCPRRKSTPPKEQVDALCNIDLMAHVAKGVLAIRIGHADRVTLCNVRIKDLSSTGARVRVPPCIQCKAGNEENPVDARSTLNFGGADSRAIFLNNSTRVSLTNVTIDGVASTHSIARGIEFDRVTQEDDGTTTLNNAMVCKLKGICRSAVYLQSGCSDLQVENVRCDSDSTGNSESLVQELIQIVGDVTPALSVTTLRNVVSRFVCDPSLLVVETQGEQKSLAKLCLSSSSSA